MKTNGESRDSIIADIIAVHLKPTKLARPPPRAGPKFNYILKYIY